MITKREYKQIEIAILASHSPMNQGKEQSMWKTTALGILKTYLEDEEEKYGRKIR